MRFAAAVGVINCDLLFSGVPRLPNEGEEIYAKGFTVAFGGGVPAIMLSLSRLGVPVQLGTYLGRDMFSDFARKTLDEAGVAWRNHYTGDGVPLTVTAVAITMSDRTFLSSTADGYTDAQAVEKAYEVMRGASLVRMGANRRMLPVYRRLKDEGATLVLDMGWSASARMENCAPVFELADYYLPNRGEALMITGETSVAKAARKLSRYFPRAVVKLDREGCYLLDESGPRIVTPLPDVIMADSTGAGDAFCAGFMYGLFHGKPFDDCARLGNVMGGLCVQEVGCVTRHITEDELLQKFLLTRTIPAPEPPA